MTDYNSSHTGSDIDQAVSKTTNIDNTSDADKPVSTATQVELDKKASAANGLEDLAVAMTADIPNKTLTLTQDYDLTMNGNAIMQSHTPNFDMVIGAGGIGAAINIFSEHGHIVGAYTYNVAQGMMILSLSNATTGGSECQLSLSPDGSVGMAFCTVANITDPKDITTKEYVDGTLARKLDNSVAKFIPQVAPVTPVEGDVWYDSDKKALTIKPDVDMQQNVGQEVVARVVNNTGSPMLNGKPVYASGVSSSGVPEVSLAKADSFATSDVIGVTTHEIANGAEGFITKFGTLGGNFIGIAEDATVYLSNVTAGEFVTVAPDIATKVGKVLVTGAAGLLDVRITSNMAMPTIVGALSSGTAGSYIDATYTTVTNYSPDYSVGVPVNGTLGQITVPTVGLYRLNINFNISFTDTGNHTAVVDLQLWNVTQASEALVISSSLAKNSEGCALSPTFVYDVLVAGDVFELRVKSTGDTLDNVVYQLVTFDLESVHLRA